MIENRLYKHHGLHKTKLHKVWTRMKHRCISEEASKKKYYLDKGIKVCDEWAYDFKKFYDWAIANGYDEGLSIDRIDNEKNYEPSNCRWVKLEKQQRNKSNNIKVLINGEEILLHDIPKRYNLTNSIVHDRYKRGLRGDELLKPSQKGIVISIEGQEMSIEDASKKYNIKYATIYNRYKKGYNGLDLIAKSLRVKK